MVALDATEVSALVLDACLTEVHAFKPGNVSLASPGHGMRAEDFIASAQAASVAMAQPGLTVGERILRAIEATRFVVSFNTNLGIVLLCAPLAHAALQSSGQRDLRARLESVLAGLTVSDAELAYRAIRLAQPGGLGTSARHDVAAPPTVTLLEAMREASRRDRIASQYETVFADVFELGLPAARKFLARWQSREWTAVAVYLRYLSSFPDSLVARKHGEQTALSVTEQARHGAAMTESARDPREVLPALEAFDADLKRRSINPGTTADMTVATLVAMDLQDSLEKV
jgi:triphosphoribosyl-dephospho-CoA synthase